MSVSRLARLGRLLVLLTVGALTITPTTVAGAQPPPELPARSAAQVPTVAGPAATHRVTLLTGDIVTFTDTGGAPTFAVEPAERPDNRPVAFDGEHRGEDFFVIPSDARGQLVAGTVERELFNVRGLVRQGLSDSAGALPVIVTYSGRRASQDLTAQAEALPATGKARALPVVNGAAVQIDRGNARAFWAAVDSLTADSAQVWLDRRLTVSLGRSVPQIGAPAAWQGGHDGSGVTVAVLDTGVDAQHPDLAGKVAEARDFTGEGATDTYGHGTHVAATIAGTGAASGGRYKGVAPGARLVTGKVCGADGTCPFSTILTGMDWAARSGARVINMSLGGGPSDGTDQLSRAVNKLTAQTGALFVIAAGNDGCPVCVSTPAAANAALAVGAVDKSDNLANFSSRGPRLGDAAVKPEIVAPGVAITAARADGTSMGTPVDERYTTASGTSMATPHVAGAAALLAQAHPGWRALQLKNALVSTARDDGFAVFEQGAGRIDLARAYRQPVFGPASLNFGRVTVGGTKQLTYTNDTAAPVTLALAVGMNNYTGAPAPARVGKLNTTTLTVPARGAASALLTIKPYAAPPGAYSGLVTATSADRTVSLRTPVSYYRATPTVPVTVRLLNFDGRPVPGDNWAVLAGGTQNVNDPFDPFRTDPFPTVALKNGMGTARVPAGTYTAFAQVRDPDATRAALVAVSNVPVRRGTELVLDARKAMPSTVSTVEPTELVSHQLLLSYNTPTSGWSSNIGGRDMRLYATPTPPVQGQDALVVQDNFTLTRRPSAGSPGTVYNLSYSQDDGIPDTLEHRPDPATLIAVRTTYHADVPGLKLMRAWWGFRAGSSGVMRMPRIDLEAPATLTEYVNRDDKVDWTRHAMLSSADNKNHYAMYNRGAFPPTETWFEGPVVPAVPGFHRIGVGGPDLFRPPRTINDSVTDHLLDVDVRDEYPITWKMFNGDKEIPPQGVPGSQVPAFPLPQEASTHTLRSSMALKPTALRAPSLSVRRHSPRVDTEWTFRSVKATGRACTLTGLDYLCDIQPVLQLAYDLRLNPQNQAPASREHTIQIVAAHPKDAVGTAPIAELTVAYSVDEGNNWQSAHTSSTGAGRYQVVINNPVQGGGVWLRTEASDSAGNTVSQTVQRAYSVTS